ncbi:hypothetical protein G4G28_23210 [Massilia sp. Dwa41.01b]|uniref:hypothetical protein n=1 Tax=Massilia sp. Dwa41.01b TaxID=2709302 RepID=UPI0015FF3092|nr:hypothetical protein [Massilia sp. Dwa41.01b]QNA91193.1 hypothetical protein G4G28_23210 [Massilia sp. Dwa41.01b]
MQRGAPAARPAPCGRARLRRPAPGDGFAGLVLAAARAPAAAPLRGRRAPAREPAPAAGTGAGERRLRRAALRAGGGAGCATPGACAGAAPRARARRDPGAAAAAVERPLSRDGDERRGGYSACGDLAITRWCGDGSGADSGLSCCLRDVDSGALWSAGWRPTLAVPDGYEACLSEGRVELRRRDHDILLATEIVVSPEDDIELRRMRVTNASSAARTLELTSHVPLAWRSAGAADALPGRHFLQTEILAERGAIPGTRRPARLDETAPWLLNLMAMHGAAAGRRLVRDRRHRAVGGDRPARGHAGLVADPVCAIRRVLTLAPGEEAVVDLVLGVAATRDEAVRLADKYRARVQAERAFDLAWTHSQALLRQLGAAEADTRLYARAWPAPCSIPNARCAPTRTSSGAAARGATGCGHMRSRASCRWCWPMCATAPGWHWRASW